MMDAVFREVICVSKYPMSFNFSCFYTVNVNAFTEYVSYYYSRYVILQFITNNFCFFIINQFIFNNKSFIFCVQFLKCITYFYNIIY